ncbi:TonB-dependent receptor domain-containing protein [Flavihumibacter sp.]|uniref:TonB-dependent receptor domain-containing protein n=1 Tax=Flavihumibacter sp. TaxID=1913981 RepID=UPI002FC724C1
MDFIYPLQFNMGKFLRILVTLFIFSATTSIAQETGKDQVSVIGKVIDKTTGNPVESATITVLIKQEQEGVGTENFSRISISDRDGKFSVAVIRATSAEIFITAVGFETLKKTLRISADATEVNAGDFLLGTEATNLAGVVVTARKPLMQMGVDRRIFNADAAITSKGGNAADLMKNIPSLSVDINGNVQLRNSTPQIFVDGRPTILTLEQIPAEDIEKVEVITNPSARYDAGSTGGIINIILKKNRKAGLNGVVSVGGGTPELFNSNLSLNYRKGSVNLFASGGYNRSGGIAEGEAKRQNKSDGIITDYFDQESERERQRKFKSLRFGMDYKFNDNNTISISQGFVDGRFNNIEDQNQRYLDQNKVLTQTGTRQSLEENFFKRSNTQLNFRRTYEKAEKEWTADITYNSGNNGGESSILNQFYTPDGQLSGTQNRVENYSTGNSQQFTIQTDYVNPLSEKSKLELGARSFHNYSKDKLDVFSVANDELTKLPLSNNYSFRQVINAIYTNYSNQLGKLKYQGGLRLEQSSFTGKLLDSAKSFGYDYPSKGNDMWNAVFPSLFLTYELKEGNDLQVNFSRRIRRPNFWQINPYVDISDPMNIRKGNPELEPEFTNSFELNYNRTYSTGNILVSTYFRNNTRDITNYSDTISNAELDKLNNASIDPNAILTTFINADRTNRTGLEIVWQQRVGNSFDFTPSFNAQYRDVKASVGGLNLSNTGFNWDFELMANYKINDPDKKLLNNFSFQVSGEYESPRVTPQGRNKEQYVVDFAVRKDFLKNKAGTLTFNINDVLNSRRFGNITDTENFYQDSYRRWSVRTFRLTFSYRFGNNDIEIFKRKQGGNDDNSG